MNDTEFKTIRQIADEIGVSKQAVHQKIKRKPLSKQLQGMIKTVDGVIYIDVDGESMIKSAFSKEPSTENTESPSTFTSTLIPPVDGENTVKSAFSKEPSTENTESPSTLIPPVDTMTIDYINSLKAQIEHDRAQITDLHEESKKQSERIADLAEKLAELTRNSQVLLKQEQDKSAFLLPAQKEKRPFWQFWKK